MRVVLTTKTVYPFHLIGGMERFYYNLARFLTREGAKVEVISSALDNVLNPKTVVKGQIKFTFLPPRISRIKPTRLAMKVFDMNVARYLLKRNDFDIVHGSAGIQTYSFFKRKPMILQVLELWDPPCCENPNSYVRAYLYCLDYVGVRNAFRVADKIAVEIEAEAREVCRLYEVPYEKIIYVPPGVDVEYMDEAVRSVNIIRRDLGLSEKDFVVLCVSRLELNKGVHILVKAFSVVAKQLQAKLVLVGTGSLEPLILTMVKTYRLEDKVIHLKNVPDKMLYKLYDLCDVVVIPTLHEGLPTVLIEAMAMGKLVIASATPEISCIVRNYANGILVPPGDANLLAEALLKAYDRDLVRRLGERAKSYARSRFDWRVIAKNLMCIYEKLVCS